MTRPFEGVKILDFTQVLAGPYASYQLALLGADVVKIERRGGEDMRRTPLSREWAERNLALNGLADGRNTLVRADVLPWMESTATTDDRWNLVVLDPPAHSTSKAMRGDFNVQRDQRRLLEATLALLAPGGILYFSTNYRGFRLMPERLPATFQELTPKSLPPDVHQRDAHRCWLVRPTD